MGTMLKNRQKTSRLIRTAWETLENRKYFSITPTFATNTDFTLGSGSQPVAIAAVDFNGDGTSDVAVADAGSKSIRILYGVGDGTFQAGTPLAITGNPYAMIIGDFDGNGLPDIAAAQAPGTGGSTSSVTIFLNAGNETFDLGETTQVLTSQTSTDAINLVAGDFNKDGKLDIATTNFSDNSVDVLLGAGNGTFTTNTRYDVGTQPQAIATADFDKDGNLDLAVTDYKSDDTGTFPVVSFLRGDGAGNFSTSADISTGQANDPTGKAIITEDYNGDGKPDLVAANPDGSASALLNNGGLMQFTVTNIPVGGAAGAVADGDFNFDNRPDFATANANRAQAGTNTVSVVKTDDTGVFDASNDSPAGTQPLGVAAGDFNGDGKDDIVTANADGTISVLLNTTPGAAKATTLALQSLQNPSILNTPTDFLATVTVPSGGFATGTVKIYEGALVIGTGTLVPGTNQVDIPISSLSVGPHQLRALYVGNGTFGQSVSPLITQTVNASAGNGPDLVPISVKTTLPSQFVPGEVGTVVVQVKNDGSAPLVGMIISKVYLSLDDVIDDSDIPITVKGTLNGVRLAMPVGRTVPLAGTFVVPAGVALGDYKLLVDLNTNQTNIESDPTNNVGAAATTLSAVNSFGTVGGRRNVVLTLADGDGTNVTYRLIGPGTGTVTDTDLGVQLSLTGTTAASSLIITNDKAGDGRATLQSISADSRIGVVRGPTVDVGSLAIGAVINFSGIRSLVLGNLTSPGVMQDNPTSNLYGQFNLGTSPGAVIHLGTTDGMNLVDTASIAVLKVASWSSGGVAAPSIGTILSNGDFTAFVSLSGSANAKFSSLGVAKINGLVSGNWSIKGTVNQVIIGKTYVSPQSQFSGWHVSVTGTLNNLIDLGQFGGQVYASNIGAVIIRGNLDSAKIIAGAHTDQVSTDNGDGTTTVQIVTTYAAGTIRVLNIGSSVTGSVIAAGLDPVNGTFLDGDDALIPGGRIIAAVVKGDISDDSKILAARLPVKVRVGNSVVTTANDSEFSL